MTSAGIGVSHAGTVPDHPHQAWIAAGKPYVPVSDFNAVPEDASKPYCNWCGRNYPPHGLQDEHDSPPAYQCDERDSASCEALRAARLPYWTSIWYPQVHAAGYRHVVVMPTGLIQLWRYPQAAAAVGLPDLARPGAEDERTAAMREQVRRWADKRAMEILDQPKPEPQAEPVPVPAPVDLEAARWHGTIRGGSSMHHTLSHPHNRMHLLSGGAHYPRHGG